MKCSAFLSFFFLLEHCLALIDVNIHELQYISDHLSYQECRRLSAALQLDVWELPGNVTGGAEPAVPCLILLLRYDREQGRGKTFHDLSRRIQQIGRANLAKRFSRMVLHKKAEAIRKDFLDDPFREMIGVTSVFLDPLDIDNDEDDLVRKVKNKNSSGLSDSMGITEDTGIEVTRSEFSKVSGHLYEFIGSLSNTQIGLGIATALSIFLLSVTFCIFGCPRFLHKCFRCCTPSPLAECIRELYVFIRTDLCGYLNEVCCKKLGTELDTDREMNEKLLLP